MAKNLDPQTIYDFIVHDFESAWKSLAGNCEATGRGNFMFAMQDMILLEFMCRLCKSDSTNGVLRQLSDALYEIDPRYFTTLPGACAETKGFTIPFKRSQGSELLWLLFDLVRNGEAHQYQQIIAQLGESSDFVIKLTGADMPLETRPSTHLCYYRDSSKDICFVLCPNCLFLDLRKAASQVDLLGRGLSFEYLRRPGSDRPERRTHYYNFDSSSIEEALVTGGHTKLDVTTITTSGTGMISSA